jgi:hypothetical protein
VVLERKHAALPMKSVDRPEKQGKVGAQKFKREEKYCVSQFLSSKEKIRPATILPDKGSRRDPRRGVLTLT